MEYAMILLGVTLIASAIVVLVLASLVRQVVFKLNETNEKLLVMLSAKTDGESATRALVAMSRPPKSDLIPGVSSEAKKEKPKDGVEMTVGMG